jgi:alpha-galactosidase
LNRRNFIQTTGLSLASILTSDIALALGEQQQLINYPDAVSVMINDKMVQLTGRGKQQWVYQDLMVNIKNTGKTILIEIQAPKVDLYSVSLSWKTPVKETSLILNDHWERTYGDISWHQSKAAEILPWYFIEHNGTNTNGFGIKTGAAAFCFWQIGKDNLSLTMDTRSGGNGVQLGDRKLVAAEIVTIKNNFGASAFETARKFTRLMCDKARMPHQPVYGINDWYYSYGNNSEKLIEEHTRLMAPMAEGLSNRPFSVIDAGWFTAAPGTTDVSGFGDNMSEPNAKFSDMGKMAATIKTIGMRPGIWTRPLCASHKDSSNLLLPLIKGRTKQEPVLDPSIPENIERVKDYFKLYNQWGYELVKFDYTTYDIFGKWGFQMMKDAAMTAPGWNMNDRSKTNAEIILQLYKAIRGSAGKTYIIGCNTISHLSAGLFELNRIGDDTSGNEWERTRKMGVNTLAFRSVQQGNFYAADGDCVGLTKKIPWAKNKQWMELLAKSGTPLFISAQPEATGTEQKAFIKECFRIASLQLPVAEPLDWMENPFPTKWKLNGKAVEFNWG